MQQGVPTCTVQVFVDAGRLEAFADQQCRFVPSPCMTMAVGGRAESASSTEGGGHSPQPLHCWSVHCHHDGHRPSAQRKGGSLGSAVKQVHCLLRPDSQLGPRAAEVAMFVYGAAVLSPLFVTCGCGANLLDVLLGDGQCQ